MGYVAWHAVQSNDGKWRPVLTVGSKTFTLDAPQDDDDVCYAFIEDHVLNID